MIRSRNNTAPKAGYVLTPQRRLILGIIRKSGRLLGAKELYRLAGAKDNTVSLATIYRSLNLFKNIGLIDEHRLGTWCCYELKQSAEHQHVMCRHCGKIFEFESPLIPKMIDKLQNERGFKVEKVEMCIQGTCSECLMENGINKKGEKNE